MLDFRVEDGTFRALQVSQERWYGGIVKFLISESLFRRLSTPWSSIHWTQFLQLPAEKLSCIEDLHIRFINTPISNFGVQAEAPLDGFKKLTKFVSFRLDQSLHRAFDHMVSSEDPVFAHVPWHQLRHIHLGIPTPVLLCFTILQGSSMVLETCTFVVSDCYGPQWADIKSLYAEPLYCPQLRTLELEARHHPDQSDFPPILDQILLWIRMPNLKTLEVGSSSYRNIISSSTLVAMQDVSNMQLKEFTFYHHACSMDVGLLLTTFPSLKRVKVLGLAHFYNDTISQLGSGLIGPCLEELILDCCDIDIGKILRMVKVRSSIGKLANRDEWQVAHEPTSFRYVKLYRSWSSVEPEYKETIEEVNRYGVQLIVEKWTYEVLRSQQS